MWCVYMVAEVGMTSIGVFLQGVEDWFEFVVWSLAIFFFLIIHETLL